MCTVQNPRTITTDTRTVKHNKKATVTMIEGGAQKPCLKIIIQEEGCDQRVRQDRMLFLIDSILEKLIHEEMQLWLR